MKESWIICIHELKIYLCDKIDYPISSYLFKVNKRNIRAMSEICSKLKIKTPEQCQWRSSGFLISNFEHISLSISKCLAIYIVKTLNSEAATKGVLWEKIFSEVGTLLKKRLWHRCFPMNFAKFLRMPYF